MLIISWMQKGKYFLIIIKKKDCISYADGTKMSNVVKYKIINYLSMWLKSKNLLSDEVTLSIE